MTTLSFGGVDMDVRKAGDTSVPDWELQARNVTTTVPFANWEQVQWVGASNPRLTVEARIDGGDDLDTLRDALRDGTVGTLSYLGDNFSNVHIDAITSVRRYDPGRSAIRWATITFVQVNES